MVLCATSIAQTRPVLDRYGPWTEAELTKFSAVADLVQEYRATDGQRHSHAATLLQWTDIRTLVRGLFSKSMREESGLEPWAMTLQEIVSPRLRELANMMAWTGSPTDSGRDVEMACQIIDSRWPQSHLYVSTLAQAMSEGSPQAFIKLREFGPQAQNAMPVLSRMLLDPDCTQDAGAVLFSIGRNAIPTLTGALGSQSPVLRARAAGPLVALIAMDDPTIQPRSMTILTRILADSALDSLPASQYGFNTPRFQALNMLGRFGVQDERAVLALAGALKDPNQMISLCAAGQLGWLGAAAKAAGPAMLGALTDSRGDVRTACAKSFIAWGDAARPWLPAIRSLLDGKEFDKDFTAAYTLSYFGPEGVAAMPVLISGLHAPGGPLMHELAAEAIYRLGDSAKSYLPSIRELLKDKDPEVRRAATGVIAHLEK